MPDFELKDSGKKLTFTRSEKGVKVEFNQEIKWRNKENVSISPKLSAGVKISGLDKINKDDREWFLDEYERQYRKAFTKHFDFYLDVARKNFEGIYNLDLTVRKVLRKKIKHTKDESRKQKLKDDFDKHWTGERKVKEEKIKKNLEDIFKRECEKVGNLAFKASMAGAKGKKRIFKKDPDSWKLNLTLVSYTTTVIVVTTGMALLVLADAGTSALAVGGVATGLRDLSAGVGILNTFGKKLEQYQKADKAFKKLLSSSIETLNKLKSEYETSYKISMVMRNHVEACQKDLDKFDRNFDETVTKNKSRKTKEAKLKAALKKAEKNLKDFNEALSNDKRQEIIANISAAIASISNASKQSGAINLPATEDAIGTLAGVISGVAAGVDG